MIAESGTARLAYDVIGPRDTSAAAADVLFIHAGVTDRRSWTPLTDRLADRFRCITYDQRGYGESSWSAEPFSRSADARAVLDAAESQRALVVGGSMGGHGALDLAVETPDRVSALVLIGAAVSGAPEDDELLPDIAELYPLIQAAEDRGDLDEVNRLEAWFWLDGPTAPEGRVSGPVRDLFLEMNGRALAAPETGDSDSSTDAWSQLDRIEIPTLVLIGDLDLVEVQQTNVAMAKRIPGATLVRLPGVAHLPQLEGDPTTLTAVTDFLTTHGG